MVTGQLPFSYDLDGGWLWRLPGSSPWNDRYLHSLAEWMMWLSPEELAAKRSAVPREPPEFQQASQVARVTAFLNDLLS